MIVPSRKQCLMLMDSHRMPAHIQEHSLSVAQIAVGLGVHSNSRGAGLALSLLEAGALLHDIAKSRCLHTGENHAVIGGQMVRQQGYPHVARIVEEHVSIAPGDLAGPVNESLLVNYADKRVKHTEVVTLEDRFGDLAERYGDTAERKARLAKNLSLFMELEAKIFAGLRIQPQDILGWAQDMDVPGSGSYGRMAEGRSVDRTTGARLTG
jgi:uncharacterized protein